LNSSQSNPTYTVATLSKEEIINTGKSMMKDEEYGLSFLYWMLNYTQVTIQTTL